MIKAKLFETKEIDCKFMTAADRIQDEQYEAHSYLKQTYVTEILLIYREGNE